MFIRVYSHIDSRIFLYSYAYFLPFMLYFMEISNLLEHSKICNHTVSFMWWRHHQKSINRSKADVGGGWAWSFKDRCQSISIKSSFAAPQVTALLQHRRLKQGCHWWWLVGGRVEKVEWLTLANIAQHKESGAKSLSIKSLEPNLKHLKGAWYQVISGHRGKESSFV